MARKNVADETNDLLEWFPFLAPLLADRDSAKTWVVDMEAIRPHLSSKMRDEMPVDFRRMVFGYDVLVILPEFHRGTRISP